VSGVGDGGSALGWGVPRRSVIVRSVMPRIRDSTASDPLSPSFARALLSPVAMNGVMPSGSPTKCLRSTDVLGL
jgi:hypothetical protein